MRNLNLFFTFCLFVGIASAQVGIGTSMPSTTLEVIADPTNINFRDGITIPKLSCSQINLKHALTPYDTNQTGTMLYITDVSGGLCVTSPPTSVVAANGIGSYVFDGIEFKKIELANSPVIFTQWSTLGNFGTSTLNNFLGTTDNVGFSIRTNNTERIRVSEEGKVGIANSAPSVSFDVTGYPTDITFKSGVKPPSLSCLQLINKNMSNAYVPSDLGTIIYINNVATCSSLPPTSQVNGIGLYQFDGAEFQRIVYRSSIPVETDIVGDIKPKLLTSDHTNWFLLDGRSCGSSDFTTTQQLNCLSLGLPLNTLPNATNANGANQRSATYLANIDGNASTRGIISGNLTNTWTSSDLPNLSHTHQVDPPSTLTNTTGNHNHTYPGTNSATNVQNGSNETVMDSSIGSRSTSTNGNHSHSLNIAAFASASNNPGGGGASVPVSPRTLDVNMFVYLGS